mgnify:FL=1
MWEDNLWNEMKRIRIRMNRALGFSDFPRKTIEIGPANYRQAWADFKEDESSYTIEAEIPGVGKDNIKVEVVDNNLVIKAEKKQEIEQEDNNEESSQSVYRYTKSYAGFYRTVELPEGAEAESINAEYNDGILSITIPKNREAKKKKFIKVR